MQQPCRRPRPVGPPPFGGGARPARDRTPRRPRPAGNPPALSSLILCQRGDAAREGNVAVIEQPTSADEHPSNMVLRKAPDEDSLSR